MRVTPLFLLSLLMGLNVAAVANATGSVDSCLEKGKKSFAAKEYTQAKTLFEQCVKEDPSSVDSLLSLAGTCLTLDQLNEAEKYFKKALEKMGKKSPYVSYTYSMLGDIALKKQKNKEALDFYTKSLQSNAANVNSLIGKGVILEYQEDKVGAAEFYRSALAVEPLNLIARQRLINLEPDYFTDAEMLTALKQRYAVAPDAKTLTEEERQLFADIHSAEQRQGIEYLKNRYTKIPVDYTVILNKGTEFEREILTLEGYNTLQKHIGQDAFNVFQRAGVPVQSIFSLRNMKGEKLFKEDSTLTKSGFFVYTEALQNRKAFLLPEESVPPTPARLEQISKRVEDLRNQGFVQISSSEKKMLERETKCFEKVLRQQFGLVVIPVTNKKKYYFASPNDQLDAKKSISYFYVMKERAKRNPNITVPNNMIIESLKYNNATLCLDDGLPLFE